MKIIFGALSSPIVFSIITVTNLLDMGETFIRQYWLSIKRNVMASYNLLGDNAVFGDRQAYDDQRSTTARRVFGALSAPIVLAIITITNSLDALGGVLKHFGKSVYFNVRYAHNFWGSMGIIGSRLSYDDPRHLATKIVYGLLSLPITVPVCLISNAIDGTAGFFKHWKHTIKTPISYALGIIAFIISAPVTFILRKSLKGFYNGTLRPIIDKTQGQSFNAGRFIRGWANIASLGVFAIIGKGFKAATGYSHRFGFPKQTEEQPQLDEKFREVSAHTASGNFSEGSGEKDGYGKLRPWIRFFYGQRHRSEQLVKEMHDQYKLQERTEAEKKDFFSSQRYLTWKEKQVDADKPIIDKLEERLKDTGSRAYP